MTAIRDNAHADAAAYGLTGAAYDRYVEVECRLVALEHDDALFDANRAEYDALVDEQEALIEAGALDMQYHAFECPHDLPITVPTYPNSGRLVTIKACTRCAPTFRRVVG